METLGRLAGFAWAVAARTLGWLWRHKRWSLLLVGTLLLTFGLIDGQTTLIVAAIGLAPGALLGIWATAWPRSFERFHAGPWRRRLWRKVARKTWPYLSDRCGLSASGTERARYSPMRGFPQKGETVKWVSRPRLMSAFTNGDVLTLRVQARAGQTPDDLMDAAPALATALSAQSFVCEQITPSQVDINLVMVDHLAQAHLAASPEQPITDSVGLGRQLNGTPWELTLTGRHTLVVGCSGSGKGSVLWGICGALAPAASADLVRLWGVDLKGGIELGMGRGLFTRMADEHSDALAVMRELRDVMNARANAMQGQSRLHHPTPGDPMHVLVIDELASLIAYETDPKARDEANKLLAALLSKGRAVGVIVVAFVQDPAKETVKARNLFTQTVALRLRSPEETRMVLGEGMATRAPAHAISPAAPGTGWVVTDSGQTQKVRADFWSDELIAHTGTRFPAAVVSVPFVDEEDDANPRTTGPAPHVTEPPRPRKPRAPRQPRSPRNNAAFDDEAA